MGLSDALICDVITWSVGASALSDTHAQQYSNEPLIKPAAAIAPPMRTVPHLICPYTEELT
ncbi:MAG: NAD(P)-dependent oxidoreductase, partial [Mesorhizobium sp.]